MEWSERNVVAHDPTTDWCSRCNVTRTTTELWALTPEGIYKIGHTVDCRCYS
jgi:hypothetical protein